jgi:type I restriction enzyme, R subunit
MPKTGRLAKIVLDIIHDMSKKDRFINGRGNAILVASSIYEACKYYKLFKDKGLDKCAIVTSYSADISEIKGEATGDAKDTENRFKYKVYQEMIGDKDIATFEKEVIEKFIKEPGQMKLLIVVDKLLTGFDAPSATYLYIDKSMRDHGLFQAICRVNRLDGDDKEYGYIIDYMDLFKSLEQAVEDYTSEAFDSFDADDVGGLLKNRAKEAKNRLNELLESLRALCEPVEYPQGTLEFIRYFCWENEGDLDQLKDNEQKRLSLYKHSNSAVRAYAEVVDNLEELEFAEHQLKRLKEEVTDFHNASKEVKLASGDYVDLKQYEADMRYIIDNYISAESSKVISTFEDMTLIELILERGVDFVKELPEGMKKDSSAAAEAIENNVRKVIVANQATNPLYYEKMSELLMKIIEDRKKQKEDYKEYLKQIVELTKKIQRPEDYAGYPERIKGSAPLRALYDNYSKDEEFVLILHEKINAVKPDKWKGDKAKEKVLLRGIYEVVDDYEAVDKVFDIVREQKEYY